MSIRSPRLSGFHQLTNQRSNPNLKMSYETDIPLTNVRTGSTTGGRRPGDNIAQTYSRSQQVNEEQEKGGGVFRRGPGGRRKATKLTRRGTDGEEISVNGLGRFYNKIVNFSVVTRYLVYVLPIALLIAIPIIVFAVVNPDAIFGSTGVRVYLFWTWIEVVWLSLWVSKLVAKVIPFVFIFLCGVVSSGTRKYAVMLRAVEIPLSLVGWAVASLITFTALTNANINFGNHFGWITVVKRLLGPALIASIIFLAEKFIIQLISVNYHRRSFDGRIKESKHAVHLLGLLFEASRTLFPMYCPEFLEEDYLINDSIEAMVAKNMKRAGNTKSGVATPLRLVGNVGRIGDKVTTVFGNIAAEVTGKQVFNPTSAHSIVIQALEKTGSSEALAKRLWMSFVIEGKEALYPDDIQEVLGPAGKDEADEAFASLDNDGNGDISLDEMIMKVVEIGRDRKAIASSMRDVGQAISVLDQILSGIILIIIVFIFVAFQNTNFVTTLSTAGATLLSLSFVFAVTAQEFLGSCIFLFVKHPFDVGDVCDIPGPSTGSLVVEQISLLYTLFKRVDNMKLVQVPNIVLNSLWIENITRSNAMKEQLDMFISFDTSLEDIEILRAEMEQFVQHPDNSRDFYPDIILEVTGLGNMDKLQLKIEIRHKSNWHNETIRASRRSKFMCALVLALRKVPIYGPGGGGEVLGGPSNPGYSVSVTDTWAAEARDKADQDKQAKRLVPADSGKDEKDGSQLDAEGAAAADLNARNPTLDAAHKDADRGAGLSPASPNDSADNRRSADVESIRQGLLKRESTRGRRKPGEAVPVFPSGGLALNVTQASPQPSPQFSPQADQSFLGRTRTRDEEAALDTRGGGQNLVPGKSDGRNYPTYQTQPLSASTPYQTQPLSAGGPYQTQQFSAGPPYPGGNQLPQQPTNQQGRSRDLTPGFKKDDEEERYI